MAKDKQAGIDDLKIRTAEPEDYGEMYTLQLAAFVDEARLYGTPDVPSLNESMQEFKKRLLVSDSWIATDRKRVVGGVSLRAYRGVPDIERLMVAPDRRGEGISSALLAVVEQAAIEAGHTSIQLVVGDLAVNNQSIYEHLGWHRTRTYHLKGNDQVLLHDMTKKLEALVPEARSNLTRFHGVLAPNSRYRESVTRQGARKVKPVTTGKQEEK